MTDTPPNAPQHPHLGYLALTGLGRGLLGVGHVIERITQPQFILSLISMAFLWWLTRNLLTNAVPDQMREVVSVLVGFITGQMVGPGWQYYFGNTKASDDKTTSLRHNAASIRAMVAPEKLPDAMKASPTDTPMPQPDPLAGLPETDPTESQVGDMTVHADRATIIAADDPKAKP